MSYILLGAPRSLRRSHLAYVRLPIRQSELRQLREERALLQYELDSLQLKWRRLGVDSDLLAHACTAALEKRDAKRSSTANEQLHAQTLEQQLFFAGMHRHVFYGSPLLQLLRAQDVFDGLHAPLSLASSDANRVSALNAHCESTLRVAPALLSRFAQPHVDKASTAVPFSHLSVMGDADHTYVASVFVCKLRYQTLDRVFRAALAACEALPQELQHCLQVQMTVEDSGELKMEQEQDASRRSYSTTRYSNEVSGVHSTQNSLFAARLADDRGVIVSDFVEHDEKQQQGSRTQLLETCMSLMMSTARDEHSGETLVLLQRVVVNRYALPATSRKLHDDVTSTMAHLNGDLLIAGVCRELQSYVS